jgi:hypothetical protein
MLYGARLLLFSMVPLYFASILYGNTPPTASVDAIEVAQTVQSLNGEVSLVAGKPTFVRTYISGSVDADTQVAGELELKQTGNNQSTRIRSGNTVTLSPGQSDTLMSRHSWKWRTRSSVKIAERTYEKRAQALHC